MTSPAIDTPVEPTPGWMVFVLGVLLLPLAAGAFILSFEQLWPVMLLGGWSTATAWLGPVVLDITASSGAVMHVVSNDRAVKNWGLGLLLGGTVLSIAGNLAGHNIRTSPGGASRAQLPPEMAGWTLPDAWQPVAIALSIAAPTAVAVLVHAFGAVFKAWLATRPTARSDSAQAAESADSDTTGNPTATRPDWTKSASSDLTPAADPTRPADMIRPDPTGDTRPARTARPAADSTDDLRQSVESGSRPAQIAVPDPTRPANPTADTVSYPTDPTARPDQPTDAPDHEPTESDDPTRPTDAAATRSDSVGSADSDLANLVARARQLVESGEIRPTADAIRPALGVGQAKAREIRDALKNDQRHGLRAVS